MNDLEVQLIVAIIDNGRSKVRSCCAQILAAHAPKSAADQKSASSADSQSPQTPIKPLEFEFNLVQFFALVDAKKIPLDVKYRKVLQDVEGFTPVMIGFWLGRLSALEALRPHIKTNLTMAQLRKIAPFAPATAQDDGTVETVYSLVNNSRANLPITYPLDLKKLSKEKLAEFKVFFGADLVITLKPQAKNESPSLLARMFNGKDAKQIESELEGATCIIANITPIIIDVIYLTVNFEARLGKLTKLPEIIYATADPERLCQAIVFACKSIVLNSDKLGDDIVTSNLRNLILFLLDKKILKMPAETEVNNDPKSLYYQLVALGHERLIKEVMEAQKLSIQKANAAADMKHDAAHTTTQAAATETSVSTDHTPISSESTLPPVDTPPCADFPDNQRFDDNRPKGAVAGVDRRKAWSLPLEMTVTPIQRVREKAKADVKDVHRVTSEKRLRVSTTLIPPLKDVGSRFSYADTFAKAKTLYAPKLSKSKVKLAKLEKPDLVATTVSASTNGFGKSSG